MTRTFDRNKYYMEHARLAVEYGYAYRFDVGINFIKVYYKEAYADLISSILDIFMPATKEA